MSVTNTLLESDIKIYLTGGASNSDVNLSLGGVTSSVELLNNVIANLFNRVELTTAQTGITQYRCITIKNTHAAKPALKVRLYFNKNTSNATTRAYFAIGAAGLNANETAIDPDTEEPPVFFEETNAIPAIAQIGDLLPSDRINIWIKWVVDPNTQSDDDDNLTIAILIDQEQSDEEPPPPTTCPAGEHYDPISDTCVPDTTPIQCPTGSHYDEELEQCVPDVDPPPAIPSFKLALVGDWDCNSRTDAVINMIKQHNVNGIVALGDQSYGSTQDCWINRMRTAFPTLFPQFIFPLIGNHDDSEDGNSGKREDIITTFPHVGPECIYAFTAGNIRFIMLNTQDDYTQGSAQYDVLVRELEESANNPAIRWIAVCYHKPSVTTDGDKHSGLTDFRDDIHELFDQYGVHFVFTGHNHMYFRTFPLNFQAGSPFWTTVTTSQGPYNNVAGTTVYTAGMGGRSLNGNSAETWVAARNDQDHGALILSVSNEGRTITIEFRDTANTVIDSAVFNAT